MVSREGITIVFRIVLFLCSSRSRLDTEMETINISMPQSSQSSWKGDVGMPQRSELSWARSLLARDVEIDRVS
jgi:hypothetical protein